MKKTSPDTLKADWSLIGNRAPWDVISSPELARALRVHLQTIANWRIRQILPPPEPASTKLKGNVVRYRISAIRAWLEGSSEEQVIWNWIAEHMPNDNIKSIEQAKFYVKYGYNLMGLQKPLNA